MQLLIGPLLERIRRFQHADEFQLDASPQPAQLRDLALLDIERDPTVRVDSSAKRACPRCDDVKLKRHFFSAKRRIEVDLCPGCGGYWLDAGELEKIRHEKAVAEATAEAGDLRVSMETIRFLYRQRGNAGGGEPV